MNKMVSIYILAGQSNMQGSGVIDEIPEFIKAKVKDIKLFEDGEPRDILYKTKFGPECGFAFELAEAFPADEMFFCKTALGGSNLYYDWNPDGVSQGDEDKYRGPLYPKLISNIEKLKAYLATQGKSWEFKGALWMQGERDSVFGFMADAYKDNLINLICQLRKDVDCPELPFVQGKIAPKKYDVENSCFHHKFRDKVRSIQEEITKEQPNTYFVETIDLPQSDNLHFNTAGQILLGQRFASKLINRASS